MNHRQIPEALRLAPRIVVFGVGGAGGNAVNNMIVNGLGGVSFVVANTDAQHLQASKTDARVQLGAGLTQGLGAGANPKVGLEAARQSEAEIAAHLEGAHMVFVTAGIGGGTGTGSAPVIAGFARDRGILTVAVVTKPFMFEGRHRMRLAEAGIAELARNVDTLIIIPNQNLFRVATAKTTFAEAFVMADEVLSAGVRSITELITLPGLINLDFADVRAVMQDMGMAMMGTGVAAGEGRALAAAMDAIQNPLLDATSLKGAKAVLINVTGGLDLSLHEIDEAAQVISDLVDPEANIIFGASLDLEMGETVKVSVVATGLTHLGQRLSAPRSDTDVASRGFAAQSPIVANRRVDTGWQTRTVVHSAVTAEGTSWTRKIRRESAYSASSAQGVSDRPQPSSPFQFSSSFLPSGLSSSATEGEQRALSGIRSPSLPGGINSCPPAASHPDGACLKVLMSDRSAGRSVQNLCDRDGRSVGSILTHVGWPWVANLQNMHRHF